MRGLLRTLIAVGLGAGLIAIFLRNADLGRVWQEFQSADPGMLGLSLLLTLATYFIRAERWQYLLAPLGQTRFWLAFKYTVIGFAVSFVVPARAGEVLRPYLLARQEGLPPTATFATIIVERMLDLVAVLVLLATFFLFFTDGVGAAAPELYRAVEVGGLAIAPVAAGVLITMFLMAGHPERVHAVVLRVEKVLPARLARAVAGLMRTFAEGLAVVRHPSRLLLAVAWSLVLWLAIAGQIWTVARAFQIAIPFGGSFLITAMLVVGVSIPTPGGVGGSHEAFRLGVTSFYGAENNAAVGAALLQHAVNFVPITLLGFWLLAQDGLNLKHLRAMATSATGPAPSPGAHGR